MILNCLTCSKEFKTYPSKVKLGKGKYCSKECASHTLFQKGQRISKATEFGAGKGYRPHNFKGWRLTKSRPNGKYYKLIYKPEHPNATKEGYVREHRLVMEEVLGRYLEADEVVDHINAEETLNNDPSNLRVMKKKDHDRMNVKLNIHRRWYETDKSS